jgi:hypothetical protein
VCINKNKKQKQKQKTKTKTKTKNKTKNIYTRTSHTTYRPFPLFTFCLFISNKYLLLFTWRHHTPSLQVFFPGHSVLAMGCTNGERRTVLSEREPTPSPGPCRPNLAVDGRDPALGRATRSDYAQRCPPRLLLLQLHTTDPTQPDKHRPARTPSRRGGSPTAVPPFFFHTWRSGGSDHSTKALGLALGPQTPPSASICSL